MKPKKSLASILFMSFFMFGCGGNSKSEQHTPLPPTLTSKTIQVIDGYLKNAEICADRDNNQICGQDEILGRTKEEGVFIVSPEDKQYALIAKVIAGETRDSDNVGQVIKSFSLIADKNSKVITPFTSLAIFQNISLKELANKYGLDEGLVSGDYIKDADLTNIENKEKAIKVHFIARTIAFSLPLMITEIEPHYLELVINKAKEFISAKELLGKVNELTDRLISVDREGNVVEQQLFNDLNTYLMGKVKWVNISTNYKILDAVGPKYNRFENGKRTVTNMYGNLEEYIVNYQTKDNELISSHNEIENVETFIFQSEYLSVSIGKTYKDLQYWWAEPDPGLLNFTENMISGVTWYELSDGDFPDFSALPSSDLKPMPKPSLREYKFNPDGTGSITIKKGFEDEPPFTQIKWSILDGTLNIYNVDVTYPFRITLMVPFERSNGALLVDDRNPILMITSKERLDAILNSWNAAIGNKIRD